MKLTFFFASALFVAACSGGSVDDIVTDSGTDAGHDATTGDGGTDAPAVDLGMDAPAVDLGMDAPSSDLGMDAITDADVDADTGPHPDASFDAPGPELPPPPPPPATLCTDTFGTVATSSCCTSTPDFPDTCLVGGCSCAPMFSHPTQVCQCPTGACFDAVRGCIPRTTP